MKLSDMIKHPLYKEGYLQGYWDAIKQLTKVTKELMTKGGNKLYEEVRKELCGEDYNGR